MKNIDLNTIEGLTKLKESLEKTISNKIEKQKIDESVKKIDSLTFGSMKSLFEGLSDRVFDSKNKNLVGKYAKTIKENKDLRTLYNLYESVLNANEVSNVDLLVNSLVSLSEGLDRKNINKGKKELSKVLKECIYASNVSNDELNTLLEGSEINKAIDYIFNNRKNTSNIFEHTNNMNVVIKYVNENMKPVVSNQKTNNELLNDLNESISGLEQWESDVIKDLTLHTLSESSKEELFNRYKNDCIAILEEKINESEILEERARFESMKRNLSDKEYVAEKLNESLFKLSELKYTLNH